jgi:hypothetical protein
MLTRKQKLYVDIVRNMHRVAGGILDLADKLEAHVWMNIPEE